MGQLKNPLAFRNDGGAYQPSAAFRRWAVEEYLLHPVRDYMYLVRGHRENILH